MHLLRLLFALLIASLSGCASFEPIRTNYEGVDAGKAVIAIGVGPGTTYSSYTLRFRRIDAGQPSESTGQFTYFKSNIFVRQAVDYKNDMETGVVIVSSLPPGRYEIFNFDIFMNAGMIQKNFSSRTPVSIPFTVKASESVYLGNYQANGSTGRNMFGIPLPSGAVFAVSSRMESDMLLAKTKVGALPTTVTDATPDVKLVNNPFFVSPTDLQRQ